ncbi:MAG: GNAT family N-acetyltransferase [Chloroflexi bacterium]|nr:GNAT family N-acetyltransferase [Chloroflexota bacterium]
MSYTVTEETFDSLADCWRDTDSLKWSSIFVLPPWLEAWWRELREGEQLLLLAVRQDAEIAGIAPLRVDGENGAVLGDIDTCDYADLIVDPERAAPAFSALLDDLDRRGVDHLHLRHLRPGSAAAGLAEAARARGLRAYCRQEAVSVELELPATWEEYLAMLTAKQRHELRRKLRRLHEMGGVNYRTLVGAGEVAASMDTFFRMFVESRRDKAIFLTPRLEAFFRSVVKAMAGAGLARLGVLELDARPAAMAMCFEHDGTVYLYNSAYDPACASLSAGLLCKVFSIKDSIERGCRKYDFLKGDEPYKGRLGGKEVPLYGCDVDMAGPVPSSSRTASGEGLCSDH